MKRRLFVAAFALTAAWIVSGCASNGSVIGPAVVMNDQFSKSLEIRGPAEYENPFGGVSKLWFLRSFVDKATGSASTQLYIEIGYLGSWNFFTTASDIETTSLQVSKIAANVDNCRGICSFSETIGISVDEKTLAKYRERGYPVKVYGKSGASFVITVTSGQINSQLDALKQAQASFGATGKKPLGVRFSDATASLYSAFGKKNENGVFIMEVTKGSVADRAGIAVGDIIYRFDGRPISNSAELREMVASVPTGKKVAIEGYRVGNGVKFVAVF